MTPKDYAIVIGIDAYTALRPLTSAVRDAAKFIEWLRSPDGGGLTGEGQVITIPGDTPDSNWLTAAPNADTLRNKLFQLGIGRGEKLGRRLYIYFSGHGFTDDVDEIAMAMANAGMGFFTNSVSLNSFHNLFSQVGFFEQVVFILDCCREQTKYTFTPQQIVDVEHFKQIFEAKNGGAPTAGGAPPDVPKVRDLFVLATGYGDQSYAPTNKDIGERRGILTRALLEGLEGKAALPDGSITAASLRAFVEKRVKEIATENSLPQEAQINDSNSEGILFKQPGGTLPRINVRISIDKTTSGEVTIFDKEKVYTRSAGEIKNDGYIWEIELEKRFAPPYILYSVNPKFSSLLDLSSAAENETYDFSFSQS